MKEIVPDYRLDMVGEPCPYPAVATLDATASPVTDTDPKPFTSTESSTAISAPAVPDNTAAPVMSLLKDFVFLLSVISMSCLVKVYPHRRESAA